jgi:helix-turn-helix protein
MECGYEAAASHLLLCGPAIRDLGSPAGPRADEFDRTPIRPGDSVISPTGGIRSPDRLRAKQALSLVEREEISRRFSMRCPLRSIARHLGRPPSTVSREVQRNSEAGRYRAARFRSSWVGSGAAPEALQVGLPSILEADATLLQRATLRDEDACIHRVSLRVPHLRDRRPLLRRLALAKRRACRVARSRAFRLALGWRELARYRYRWRLLRLRPA